jgi:hypothetical protein
MNGSSARSRPISPVNNLYSRNREKNRAALQATIGGARKRQAHGARFSSWPSAVRMSTVPSECPTSAEEPRNNNLNILAVPAGVLRRCRSLAGNGHAARPAPCIASRQRTHNCPTYYFSAP